MGTKTDDGFIVEEIMSAGEIISQTPTVTAGAYSANDAVGGLLTFANAARFDKGGGIIKDVIILDDAGQYGSRSVACDRGIDQPTQRRDGQ